ncbi:hypothetical protein [Paenibacillus montanisoli]|uniref:Uncharacterized protein n=1 Tax=Paenibacillus montanisoli TaxID=2081970 RepID=A0A328UBQ7_9BACL|nr:hypothetical protein [Paenibacillus montanisoli]RAP77764.1 hypothetical protein DL346_04710 [Paenibacillus montanisoli]
MNPNKKKFAASCFLFLIAIVGLIVTEAYASEQATAQRVKQLQALEQAQRDYFASLSYSLHDEADKRVLDKA